MVFALSWTLQVPSSGSNASSGVRVPSIAMTNILTTRIMVKISLMKFKIKMNKEHIMLPMRFEMTRACRNRGREGGQEL